eukprot:TRINITY_DN255_c0_g1_i1.p1 TRINITY_DN255_c0_g1~~TRINITY_DN255_c0_g1_i1.p1  ORF type:complete len:572 (-),score=130.21 TRINITY_DN255_c0_g1_i1:123-1838(-)
MVAIKLFLISLLVVVTLGKVALPCSPNGVLDSSDKSRCNCFAGFAPTGVDGYDCNSHPLCPPQLPDTSNGLGGNAPSMPKTTFQNDKLYILQTQPIVQNRRAQWVRFYTPRNVPGVTPLIPGADACGYPGILWNKSVSELDCNEEFWGVIPWTQHDMCGFVQDPSVGGNTTIVFKTIMVTSYNETTKSTLGQTTERTTSVAYVLTISFVRQKQIVSAITVAMTDPTIAGLVKVFITKDAMFDQMTGLITLSFQTSTVWPYALGDQAGNVVFLGFESSLPAGSQPTGVTAIFAQDPSQGSLCPSDPQSACIQHWVATINRGAATTCDIQGTFQFNDTLTCRDGGASCTSVLATLSFSALETKLCSYDTVDTGLGNAFSLSAFSSSAYNSPASTFKMESTAFFKLTALIPSVTLDSMILTNAQIIPVGGGSSDIIYSTNSGAPAVTGLDFQVQNLLTPVRPGNPGTLTFSFLLRRDPLTNTVGLLGKDNIFELGFTVQVTVDLLYHSNQRRSVTAVLSSVGKSGSGSTEITVLFDENAVLGAPQAVEQPSSSSSTIIFPTLLFVALIFSLVMF